jgi:leader peptidase (prepilin peptidase)/N-methyltransferase
MTLIFPDFTIFVFGLIVGSFLNCIIYRLEKGESFLKGRSYCPKCKHRLAWQDLVPVLSFLFLLGKCRYCKKSISFQYPLVELATAILFVLSPDIRFTIIVPFLIIIFVYDLKHYLIPDKIVYLAIGLALILGFNQVIPACGAALFFLLIVLATRGRGMGIGDIKLAFLMGLLLGWPNILVALSFAFFAGATIGLALIFAKKKSLKSAVPFGPFLIAGTFIALFFGGKIINWYLNFYAY